MPVPVLSPALLEQLAGHPLSGNVRELENLLHRAVAMSDGEALHVDFEATEAAELQLPLIEVPRQAPRDVSRDVSRDGPPEAPPRAERERPERPPGAPIPSDLQAYLDKQEREILIKALRETNFNRTATAARLGLSLRQIRYRIERLNIAAPQDFAHPEDAQDGQDD